MNEDTDQIVDGVNVTALWDRLQELGVASFEDATGSTLFLVYHPLALGPGLLVAYERHGAMLWDFEKPMNAFVLAEMGFPLRVAPTISNVLKALQLKPKPVGLLPPPGA